MSAIESCWGLKQRGTRVRGGVGVPEGPLRSPSELPLNPCTVIQGPLWDDGRWRHLTSEGLLRSKGSSGRAGMVTGAEAGRNSGAAALRPEPILRDYGSDTWRCL